MLQQDVLVVIPARQGSKGVPGKNLAPVGGMPLVVRAVRACRGARLVTRVVVSTDGLAIASACQNAGAEVVLRPPELSGDLASSESAMLHVLDTLGGDDPDVVMLVQCTSPFTTSDDIDAVAAAVVQGGADCSLAVAPFHGFLWRETPEGGIGVNHDSAVRPRRQDRPEDLLETGAAYAMRTAGFRQHRHRFFGRVSPVRTDSARVLEIDEPSDLERARALAAILSDPAGDRPSRADIDAVVLDFDGTQTDDRVLIDIDGGEQVLVHRGDGLGIAALRRAGIEVLILSTETNGVVAARAAKLRVPVIHGVDLKDAALQRWSQESGIDLQRVLYVGNDVNDLPCLALVGWPVAVASAHSVVRTHARLVTDTAGGFGAIHEVASWILGEELR